MTDPMDAMIGKLRKSPIARDLGRLEAEVWSRVDARAGGDIFGGKILRAELAISVVALLLGFVVAGVVGGQGAGSEQLRHSETAVLSDDSILAPSVRLEGGA